LNGAPQGYGVWNDYAWYGTDKFFFFEDNYIIMIAPTGIRGFSDTIGGARYCVRYNHVVNGAAGDHGTEGQNLRNLRVAEWYDNWFEYTHPTRTASLGVRSGGKLMHDNTITGSPTSLGQLQMFRGWSYGYQGAWGRLTAVHRGT